MKKYLKNVVFCNDGLPEEVPAEGVLYITDREEYLKVLKKAGAPVTAWLHEGNRQQDLSEASYAVEDPEQVPMETYEQIYRREKGIPWDILETKRCLVREMIPDDAKDFAKIYEAPAVKRYLRDFHGDEEGERRYIEEYQQQYRFYEYGVWSIVLKESGQVIGRVGYSQDDSAEEAGIQFGYLIGVPWQRQGLAYEVCKAVLEYGAQELNLNKVRLYAESDNIASLGLARKLGLDIEIVNGGNYSG